MNQKTVLPLQSFEDALDALHGTKYYTMLDLSKGYYKGAMKPDDIAKTALRAGAGGLYEYLIMPMGLSSSAATFHRLMEACLNDKNFEILLIFLDDILIFFRTIEEQIER